MMTGKMTDYLCYIQAIDKTLESFSSLTGLHYTMYDDRQNPLTTSKQDTVMSFVVQRRKDSFLSDFINSRLKLALRTREPFVIQGPALQYHVFIPLHHREGTLTVLGEPFYSSVDDFIRFYREKGLELGLAERSLDHWLRQIRVIRLDKIMETVKDIQSILENLIAAGYEKGKINRKFQWSRAVISLLSNIQYDGGIREICQAAVDLIICQLPVASVAFFLPTNGGFSPEIFEGRNKNILKGLVLSEKNRFLSEAFDRHIPVSVMDSHKLLQGGFPEEIVSLYLFPVSSPAGFFGLLGVVNSSLDGEAFDSINELCKLLGNVFGVKQTKQESENESNMLSLALLKTSNLYFLYKKPRHLCESLVDEASSLVGAEKCSLMRPVGNEDILTICAVKGFHKWLIEDIEVRKGEGIAGKVYEQGMPILIDCEEKIRQYAQAPKAHYATFSSLSLPLKVADEIMGVLNLSDKHSREPFTERDLSILAPFALQATILLKLSSYYAMSEKMRELSITDSLTDIYNRRFFDIRLEEEYQRARRYGLFLSLAIMDVDDFKLFNDTEGHPAGDNALRAIASVMSSSVRANDILVRFGGEEFAVIMPQTAKAEAVNVADRIRNNVKNLIQPTWKKYPKKQITICSGVSSYPGCGEPIANLVKAADSALYRCKTQGKDCTVYLGS